MKFKKIILWKNGSFYHDEKLKEWNDVPLEDIEKDDIMKQYLDIKQMKLTKNWSLELFRGEEA